MLKSNITFLFIWVILFTSVLLLGSWSLAQAASKSMENQNLTEEQLSFVQKSAIFICPLH